MDASYIKFAWQIFARVEKWILNVFVCECVCDDCWGRCQLNGSNWIESKEIERNSVLRLKQTYRLHMAKSMVWLQLKAWASIIAFTLWKIAATYIWWRGFFFHSFIFFLLFSLLRFGRLFITSTFSQRFAIWVDFSDRLLLLPLPLPLPLRWTFVSYRNVGPLVFIILIRVQLVVLFQNFLRFYIDSQILFLAVLCFVLFCFIFLQLFFFCLSSSSIRVIVVVVFVVASDQNIIALVPMLLPFVVYLVFLANCVDFIFVHRIDRYIRLLCESLMLCALRKQMFVSSPREWFT